MNMNQNNNIFDRRLRGLLSVSGVERGELQHQVRAASQGHLGPGMLVRQGGRPPLDEVPAHGADDGGVLSQQAADRSQQIEMARVQGIVLCNDTSSPQKNHLKTMTKK